MRRLILVGASVAVVCALVVAPDAWARARKPTGIYVSTSGIPHADVGDYRQADHWRPGMPTGIGRAWRRALNTVIGRIAAEQPDAVFHTGDMVEGRWGVDRRATGIFGPVNTLQRRKRAIRRAGDLYYSQMKERWARHGLYPHFGIGDHELGDVGGVGLVHPTRLRYRALSAWRGTWARHFTDGGTRYQLHPSAGQHRATAYAARLGDVGLVTLDPFDKTPAGTRVRITGRQLRWLRTAVASLRSRGARWIVVQCEIPALGPNRETRSSGLTLRNGRRLWRVLEDLEVDLLLSAEFHAMTARSAGGRAPVQVVHGGSLRWASVNYLVIKTYEDRVELVLKQVPGRTKIGNGTIWAPSLHRAPNRIRVSPKAERVGTLTLHEDGRLSNRSGYLLEGI